uniref:Uncharacterized protein n=1 Tax=Amphimedon queenslandica TaxID=400682 RepID=A0A1X7TB19_AMPQE
MCSVVEVCNLKSGRWEQKPTTGDPPLGVHSYAAAVIRNEIFFFGGWCGHDNCYHNSLFSFNVDTLNWKELSPTTSHHGPMMRVQCGMTATIPDSFTNRYYHSLSVWNETQNTHWIIEFGGLRSGSILSNTIFIETISRHDLVVQPVLDINGYQKRRVLDPLSDPSSDKDILDKKPHNNDLLRLFKSCSSHHTVIGTALDVK